MERAGKSKKGERDRISSLPDFLIHLIMSFLTAQEAVRTCILSKRWKNLWTTLPYLDFNLSEFSYHGESDDHDSESYIYYDESEKLDKFRDFVGMALLLRKESGLHTFQLSCRAMREWSKYSMFIRSWFFYALNHNPQVLNIDDSLGSLPLAVFICASLVDASFSYFKRVRDIKVINLPCLKRLHLKEGDLTRGFVEKLFSGCPRLEFFHLVDCKRELYTIDSQSLKYLKAEYCDNNFWREATEKEIMLINAPNLLSFWDTICLDFMGPKMLLEMPSLTSANICFEKSSCERSYDGKSNILMGLSNVQNLKLSGDGIKVLLETEMLNCPEFLNLKDLSVDSFCLSCHCNLLASFLNHCPNLVKLSLNYHTIPGFNCKDEMHGIREPLRIVPCKSKILQTIEVIFDRNDETVPEVMKYLQEITKKSKAQINMTSLCNWEVDSSEEVSQ